MDPSVRTQQSAHSGYADEHASHVRESGRAGPNRGDRTRGVDILPALKGRGFQLRDPEGSVLRFTVHRPGHRRASLRSPGVSRRDVASRVQVGVRGVAAEPADEARLARATPQSLAATADNLAALSGLTADNPRRQATFAQLQAPVHDKLAELAETITRRRTQGFAAAQSVVLTDRGAGSMAN